MTHNNIGHQFLCIYSNGKYAQRKHRLHIKNVEVGFIVSADVYAYGNYLRSYIKKSTSTASHAHIRSSSDMDITFENEQNKKTALAHIDFS